jgi:hypothetical protein
MTLGWGQGHMTSQRISQTMWMRADQAKNKESEYFLDDTDQDWGLWSGLWSLWGWMLELGLIVDLSRRAWSEIRPNQKDSDV